MFFLKIVFFLTMISLHLTPVGQAMAQRRGQYGSHPGVLRAHGGYHLYGRPYPHYAYHRHHPSLYRGWHLHPGVHGGRGYFGRYGIVPYGQTQYPWYHNYDEGVYYYASPHYYSYPRDIHYLDSDDNLDSLYYYYYGFPHTQTWTPYSHPYTPAPSYIYEPSDPFMNENYSLPANADIPPNF